MAISAAEKRAKTEYAKRNFDQMKLLPRKDEAEFIRESAAKRGESVTGYLVNCANLREGKPLTERKLLPTRKLIEKEEVAE